MSKLKPKYNFLIFIFLIMTLVFCIDGVKAVDYSSEYDAGSYIQYDYSYLINYDDVSSLVNEDNYNQEDVIYNLFQIFMEKSGLNYNFSDYLNVEAELWNSGYQENYQFHFSTMDFYNVNDQVYGTKGDTIYIRIDKNYQKIHFTYNVPDNSNDDPHYSFSARVYAGSRASTSTNITGISKQLNFEGYDSQFDENLFKDNPDFKQVCVESNKKFAITATSLDSPDENKENYDVDYMWFPYQLIGLNSAFYDSSNEFNSSYYTELEDSHFHHYFNSIERINDVYNNDLYFSKKGYTNSNSYYLWSAYPFEILDQENHSKFKFYWFENPMTITQGSSGTVHGGGGLTLGSDKEIELGKQYCFYIKNQYNVEYLNVDEYGDVYGQITLPSGLKNIVTSYYKNNKPSGGLLSQVSVFVNEISEPLDFIKDNVYQFYLSMPLILRMFLTSVFSILIVKFIIGMVVK